jgi:hypothetical protein
MSEIQIKCERDSVCAGDDVDAPHSYKFTVPQNADLSEIFAHLERKGYLALVAGLNHSWEAVIGKQTVAIFKGNNRSPEASKYLNQKAKKFIANGYVNVFIKYNSATT